MRRIIPLLVLAAFALPLRAETLSHFVTAKREGPIREVKRGEYSNIYSCFLAKGASVTVVGEMGGMRSVSYVATGKLKNECPSGHYMAPANAVRK